MAMYIGGVHPDLSRVRFEQFPLRVIASAHTIRIGNRQFAAQRSKPYRIYVSGSVVNGSFSGVSSGLMPYVEAAYKLGSITKEAYAAAQAEVNSQKSDSIKLTLASELRRCAERLGLSLTNDQKAALDRLVKRPATDHE